MQVLSEGNRAGIDAPRPLSPLADAIVDRAIDNLNRKLVGGFRNKNNSRAGANTVSPSTLASDTLEAVGTDSVMAVANRGVAWREMIEKSLTHGISSLSTLKFDGEFTVKDGVAQGLEDVPKSPGVYVVYDDAGAPLYVGDSTKIRQRWVAGHLNAHRQGQRSGEGYKLSEALEKGCTVRYIKMDSEETAAALEAQLIKQESPPLNSREELKNEQGKRSNIEGKKLKDAGGSTATLVAGAATEAAKNSGWQVLEQLSAALVKALKVELVDILAGGAARLKVRVERILKKVWEVIKRIVEAPAQLLAGIAEFIVNALSKTIREIYTLARNTLELGRSAWQLYRGAKTMSTEELVEKISETLIISGSLIVWDALDPVIESQLLVLGPVAPYLASTMTAIGFGVTSHYLRGFVPEIVTFLLNARLQYGEALEAQKSACDQLIANYEREIETVLALGEYLQSSRAFCVETAEHTRALSEPHTIEALDVRTLLALPAGAKA